MPLSPVSLEQLRDYVFCSMLYYWKHVVGLRGEWAPRTTLEIPGDSLRQAWRVYARRQEAGLQEAVMVVWRTWLAREGADEDDVLKGLAGYAQALAHILEGFESGKIRKRDGSRYKQPRMSRKFKSMARSSGLPALAKELDRKLMAALRVEQVDHPLFGPYSVADAFADSLRMAERLAAPGEAPANPAILGIQVPVQVRVGGWVLPARADMLVMDELENTPPSVLVEVHDYDLARTPSARMVSRDLRVIAALHMEPLPESTIAFGEVTGVTYRHIPTGWTHRRRMAAGGRLTHVLETTLRGIQEGVYLPMFLVDLSRCEVCAMRARCFNPGGLDALEALAPGLSNRAQAVAESVRVVAGGLDPGQRKLLVGLLRRLAEELAERGGLTGDLPAAVTVARQMLEPAVMWER